MISRIPPRDDPQFKALEARLAAAAKEIEAVMAEAEQLWPNPERVWTANFVAGMPEKAYLYHSYIPKTTEDDDI